MIYSTEIQAHGRDKTPRHLCACSSGKNYFASYLRCPAGGPPIHLGFIIVPRHLDNLANHSVTPPLVMALLLSTDIPRNAHYRDPLTVVTAGPLFNNAACITFQLSFPTYGRKRKVEKEKEHCESLFK
ncbi:hypothetical protein MY4038_001436, partial [Beauveria bassiana]